MSPEPYCCRRVINVQRVTRVTRIKQVLGIKNDAARMKVTPPLAVAPLAQEDDMQWNPNDDGINMYPYGSRAPTAPKSGHAPSGSSGHEHGPTPQVAATAQTGGARRRAARPAHTSVFVC